MKNPICKNQRCSETRKMICQKTDYCEKYLEWERTYKNANIINRISTVENLYNMLDKYIKDGKKDYIITFDDEYKISSIRESNTENAIDLF